MSFYDDRIKKQPKENQEIYYAWVEDYKRLGFSESSLIRYMSTVTEFFEECVDCSILDIDVQKIEDFLNSQERKLSSKSAKVSYLKHFLAFVERRHRAEIRWKFKVEDLMALKPAAKETREETERAKPLTAQELIRLYIFFDRHIQEPRWLQSYTIFRLMYNYGIDKFAIAKIGKTLDLNTGEFFPNGSTRSVKLDEELLTIFKKNGLNFLPSNNTNVYDRLTDIEEVLDRNITQKIVEKTRERFKFKCPDCDELFENDPREFGFIQVDVLNLGALMVCKNCLEKYK